MFSGGRKRDPCDRLKGRDNPHACCTSYPRCGVFRLASHPTIQFFSNTINEARHKFACIAVSKIERIRCNLIQCSRYGENINYEGFFKQKRGRKICAVLSRARPN